MSAPEARLIWSAAIDASALTVAALPATRAASTTFDLARLGSRAVVARGGAGEHVAIADCAVRLRLDVIEGSVCAGPVLLEHRLSVSMVDRLSLPMLQLAALCRTVNWQAPPDPHLSRLIVALRVLDAMADGASLRTIAAVILGAVGSDWPGRGESTKSRVRRLVALARRLERSGPRGVLMRLL